MGQAIGKATTSTGRPGCGHDEYLEPVVQQMLLVLADDKLTELNRLKGIELALGEQGAKVHQQG